MALTAEEVLQRLFEGDSDEDEEEVGDFVDEDGSTITLDPTVLSAALPDTETPAEKDSLLLNDVELADTESLSAEDAGSGDEPDEKGDSELREGEHYLEQSAVDIFSEDDSSSADAANYAQQQSLESTPGRKTIGERRGRRGLGKRFIHDRGEGSCDKGGPSQGKRGTQGRRRGEGSFEGRGRSRGRRGTQGRRRGESSRGRTRGRRGVQRRGRGGSSYGERGRKRRSERKQGGRKKKKKLGLPWKEFTDKEDSPSIQFTGTPGVSIQAQSCSTPLDFFKLFFTVGTITAIVEQTNRYAQQCYACNEVATPWSPVTANDILAYFALNIAMGIVNLPSVHDYWSTEEITAVPWFHSIMSRTRFYQITRFLHVVDNQAARNAGLDKEDKLYKLRPLLDAINEACENHKYPDQPVSIDESMIGTKCRIGFLQYLPKKPTKWGVKVWVLADAKTGYVHKFQVYTGRQESQNATHGLAYRVVMDLMDQLLDKGHIVYTDNFYTGVSLALDLRKRNTFICGTVRQAVKNFPEDIRTKVLTIDKETCVFRKYEELTCVRWREKKRDVFLLSTKDRNKLVSVTRRGLHGQGKEIEVPLVVANYNENMGGVDVGDQLMVYYAIGRRTLKWWRRVFWRMVEIAVINSYLLYKELVLRDSPTERKKGSHKKFRLALCHALVAPLINGRAAPEAPIVSPRGGRHPTPNIDRLQGKHFGQHTSKRERCVCCSTRKRRNGTYGNKRPMWECRTCGVNLCKEPCFQIYHTRKDYWKYAPKC